MGLLQILAKLTLDTLGFTKGLSNAEKQAKNSGDKIKNDFQKNFGKGLIVATFGIATRDAIEFSKAINEGTANAEQLGAVLHEGLTVELAEAVGTFGRLRIQAASLFSTLLGGVGAVANRASSTLERGFRGLGGLVFGAIEGDAVGGAKAALDQFDSEMVKREEARIKKRDASGGLKEPTSVAQARAAASERKELLADMERLSKVQHDANLKAMTDEEKLLYITRQRASLVGFIANTATNESQRVKAQIALAELGEGPTAKAKKVKSFDSPAMDSLARIGGFTAGADSTSRLVTLQERIARATEDTAKNTKGDFL